MLQRHDVATCITVCASIFQLKLILSRLQNCGLQGSLKHKKQYLLLYVYVPTYTYRQKPLAKPPTHAKSMPKYQPLQCTLQGRKLQTIKEWKCTKFAIPYKKTITVHWKHETNHNSSHTHLWSGNLEACHRPAATSKASYFGTSTKKGERQQWDVEAARGLQPYKYHRASTTHTLLLCLSHLLSHESSLSTSQCTSWCRHYS